MRRFAKQEIGSTLMWVLQHAFDSQLEAFDTELADEEWEDEFRRFGRMSGRASRPRMRSIPRLGDHHERTI